MSVMDIATAFPTNNDVETENKGNIDNDINVEVNNDVNNIKNTEIDTMKALKAKMSAAKKKGENKQVTVYLTPENFKRFNKLKEKGQKSELINRLLDMYFEN